MPGPEDPRERLADPGQVVALARGRSTSGHALKVAKLLVTCKLMLLCSRRRGRDSGGTSCSTPSRSQLREQRLGRRPPRMVRPAAASGALPAVIVIHEAWGAGRAHPRHRRPHRRRRLPGARARPVRARRRAARPSSRPTASTRSSGSPTRCRPAGSATARCASTALEGMPETERSALARVASRRCSPAWRRPTRSSPTCAARSPTCATIPTATARSARSGSAWAAGSPACSPATSAACAPAVVYYGTPPPAERVGRHRLPAARHLRRRGRPHHRAPCPRSPRRWRAAGKRFDHHVYPGAPHAFFNDTRPRYRVRAARDAWARTLAFLVEQLG